MRRGFLSRSSTISEAYWGHATRAPRGLLFVFPSTFAGAGKFPGDTPRALCGRALAHIDVVVRC
jgi:hypothetical protein